MAEFGADFHREAAAPWWKSLFRFTPVIGTFLAVCAAVFLAMSVHAVLSPAGLMTSSSAALNVASQPLLDRTNFGWKLLLDGGRMTAYGEWWRVITSSIVHLNASHLVFNLLAIFFIGQAIERNYGATITAGVVLASAGGGALACLWFQPGVMVGGASTVAFGLMAMLFGMKIRAREQTRSAVAMVIIYFGWTFIAPGVSLWGHVGGFAGGLVIFILVAGLLGWSDRPGHAATQQKVRGAEVSAVVAGVLLIATAMWVGVANKYPVPRAPVTAISSPSSSANQ